MSFNPGLKDTVVGTVTISGTVTANPTYYITQYDDAGSSIIYIGKALPGSSTASASWQIQRMDESSTPDFNVKFADGTAAFTKIWDNRATYSYS